MSSVPRSDADLANVSRHSGMTPANFHGVVWDSDKHALPAPHASPEGLDVAIIDDRVLMRDCFGRCLKLIEPNLDLRFHSSVEDFVQTQPADAANMRVVLMCVVWSKSRADFFLSQIASLNESKGASAIVVLSDIEDLDDVTRVIEGGASGYIPTSVSPEVAVKAIQLVAAGGIYIPASAFFCSNRMVKEISQPAKKQNDNGFTSRQAAVIEALRRGKANKIIAYELNMCESTVKVHIRNIMKKLKAKNRTEVAYILNTASAGDRAFVHN